MKTNWIRTSPLAQPTGLGVGQWTIRCGWPSAKQLEQDPRAPSEWHEEVGLQAKYVLASRRLPLTKQWPRSTHEQAKKWAVQVKWRIPTRENRATEVIRRF